MTEGPTSTGSSAPPRRRARPAAVALAVAAVLAAAAALVSWRQRDFWSETSANYLRERLAADFGAEFQSEGVRVRWFPPALSLGRVTFHRRGEPWVLVAEDVRSSLNLYALLFGRERLGKVTLRRPRLFVRVPAAVAGGGGGAPPAPVAPASAGAGARGPAALLRLPLPFRALEVEDGTVEVLDRAGRRHVAAGVSLAVLLAPGRAQGSLEARGVRVGAGAGALDLGSLRVSFGADERRLAVQELSLAGGAVAAALGGSMGWDGAVELRGSVSSRLERLVALLVPGARAAGAVRFEGALLGRWDEPRAEGVVSLREPSAGGVALPSGEARVAWSARTLELSGVRFPVGDGVFTAAGAVELAGARPRWRLEAAAAGVAPARLPGGAPPGLSAVAGLDGVLRARGEGLGRAAAGELSLEARLAVPAAPGGAVALGAEASLAAGALAVRSWRASAGPVELSGSGSWAPGAGFSGPVRGGVADLSALRPALAGRAVLEGTLAVGPGGPRFAGPVRVEGLAVAGVGGIGAEVRVEADAAGARLAAGALTWPGGRGSITGVVELPGGRLNVVTVLDGVDLAEAARLAKADPGLFGGTVAATAVWRGTVAAPEVSGRARGGPLRYRAATVDEASLSFAWAGGRLAVTDLTARRGSSSLALRGEVVGGTAVSGELTSPGFEARDLLPDAGLDLAGTLRARFGGTLREPEAAGEVRVSRLRYAGFDLKGGVLEVDARGGKVALTGWVAAEENRLRAVLEPAFGWRFEADLRLAQLAPEVLRSGIGALPPGIARALGRASFLASGQLRARGRLAGERSLAADLVLDSLWLQAAGKTLQNLAPVAVSWRDGRLSVDELRLAGDRYRFSLAGSGSPAQGWDLAAEGTVNLAVFRDWWAELEEVEGVGDLRFAVRGPWESPAPEGSVVVRDGFVRARSLPEPVAGLAGTVELRGRTLTASGLAGTIGGGAFRGGGTYRLDDGVLDARVEGRLDLSLFRARVPAARELRGPVDVRLRMEGPAAAPRLSGEVDVLDAELFVRSVPAKITRVRGRLLLAGERIEVASLTAQAGGGTIGLAGAMDWGRTPARVDFDLTGAGIVLSLAGLVKAQADLALGLHGDFSGLALTGEVRLLKGRYLVEFGERPPSPVAAGGAAGGGGGEGRGGGPDLRRTALDVKVRAVDNIWIANKMAKIEAAIAVDLGGTLGAPVVSGEIQGIQGEAYFLSRLFRLESGSLRFVPPDPIPALDLQASTTVGDTQVLFIMDGPVNRPSYHLASLPAMSQEDLVSLLTIGETRASIERRGERASALGAAMFSSEPIVNALGDEARSAVGLEVFQLTPVFGENNEVSARLTLGTHLSDRLFVSYSRNLGATEDQQIKLEYQLLDYLSLWGQELREGIYSLDLVFRYAFP